MSLNPFASVEDYPSMLDKIGWFNFFGGLILGFILSNRIFEIGTSVQTPFLVEIAGIKVSFVLVIGAMAIAIISRAIKLHDKISDLFRIRKNFDCRYILTPMFEKLGIAVDARILIGVRKQRIRLMNDHFYQYATSTKERCQIDYHNVVLALDQWSWYWVLIEWCVLLLISSVIGFFYEDAYLGYGFLLVFTVFQIWAHYMKEKWCSHYAEIEVDEILADPARRVRIESQLTDFVNAL